MQKSNKVELVYQYLLNEIASMHYNSGDKLTITKIAKTCGVSEIPVREALQKLKSDGYIDIIPNQGAVVIGVSKDKIANIVQIKGVLEGYATRLSIDYLTVNDLRILHEINVEQKAATESNDSHLASELNQRFHMTIYQHMPQKELIDLISELWVKWSFTKNIFSVSQTIRNQSYEEHERILELIAERKYAEVEQFVREHKLKAIASWSK